MCLLVLLLHIVLALVLVIILVLVLILVFVLEHAVLCLDSNTFIPAVLGHFVVLEGITALLTEHPTAGQAGGRLHHRLCSVQGPLTDPVLLEEGLLNNILHPCC